MIGKVPKPGRGFRGLINYLLHGPKQNPKAEKRVAWTELANLLIDDADLAPSIMYQTARKSRRVKSPVYHLVISWHKNEAPTEDLMRQVARTTCDDIGLADHQRVTIAHHDTDHRHVHIVVNRVNPHTGLAWNPRQDYVAIEQSLRRQAESYGMDFVPGRHNSQVIDPTTPRRAKDGDHRRAKKQGTTPRPTWSTAAVSNHRQTLTETFASAVSWSDLEIALATRNMRLERKGQGMVIVDSTGEVKLSSIGKDLRLATLEQRFGHRYAEHQAETTVRRQQPPSRPEPRTALTTPTQPLPPPSAPTQKPDLVSPKPTPSSQQQTKKHRRDELSQAQAEADMAFTLYNAGLVNRRELASSVRNRDRAKEALDQTRSWKEKLSGEVAQALKPDRKKPKPSQKGDDPPDSPKPQKKRRHTMGR